MTIDGEWDFQLKLPQGLQQTQNFFENCEVVDNCKSKKHTQSLKWRARLSTVNQPSEERDSTCQKKENQ